MVLKLNVASTMLLLNEFQISSYDLITTIDVAKVSFMTNFTVFTRFLGSFF